MQAITEWSKNLRVEVRGDDVAQHAGAYEVGRGDAMMAPVLVRLLISRLQHHAVAITIATW